MEKYPKNGRVQSSPTAVRPKTVHQCTCNREPLPTIQPRCSASRRDKAFYNAERHHNQHKTFLPTLNIGDKVKLQCPNTKLWVVEGTIVEAREDKLSYIVQVGNKQQIRARRMLKLCHKRALPSPQTHHSPPNTSNANTVSNSTPQQPKL